MRASEAAPYLHTFMDFIPKCSPSDKVVRGHMTLLEKHTEFLPATLGGHGSYAGHFL